jgi:hypothetical protein
VVFQLGHKVQLYNNINEKCYLINQCDVLL